MKPSLLLHIGTWKTGSTAIQAFCKGHAPQLEEHGIGYPIIAPADSAQRNHGRLDTLMNTCLRTGDDGEVNSYLRQILGSVNEKPFTRIVFSAESFWPRSPQYVAKFVGLLSEFFDPIDVVVYFRSQVDLWSSIYSQQSKILKVTTASALWGDRDVVGADIVDHGMYYDRILDVYVSHLGRDHVHPRVYDRKYFPSSDIVEDFLALLGSPHIQRSPSTKEEINPGWSWKGIEFSKLIAQGLSCSSVDQKHVIRAVQKTVATMERRGYSFWRRSQANYFTPEQQQEIYQHYSDSNNRLFSTYLSGVDPFPLRSLPVSAGTLYDVPADELSTALGLLTTFQDSFASA
jgi:hypothetical protein